jgi:hypothetical protein
MLIKLFTSSILGSCIGISAFYELIIYKIHTNPAKILIMALTLNRLFKLILDIPSGFLFFKLGYKYNLIIQHLFLILASVFMHQFKLITAPMILIGSATVFFNGKYETAIFEYLKSKHKEIQFRKHISMLYFLQDIFTSITIMFLKDLDAKYIQLQTVSFSLICISIGLTISYTESNKMKKNLIPFNFHSFFNSLKDNYFAIFSFAFTYASVFSMSKILNLYLIENHSTDFSFKYTSMIRFSLGFGAFVSFLFLSSIQNKTNNYIKLIFILMLLCDILAVSNLIFFNGTRIILFAILINLSYALTEVLTESFIERNDYRILNISLSTWTANFIRFLIPLMVLFFQNIKIALSTIFIIHFCGIFCLLLQVKKITISKT